MRCRRSREGASAVPCATARRRACDASGLPLRDLPQELGFRILDERRRAPGQAPHPERQIRAATRIIAARAARRSTGSSVATAALTFTATARRPARSRSLRPARSTTRGSGRAQPTYLVRRKTALGRDSRGRHPGTRKPGLRRTAIRLRRASETPSRADEIIE